MSNVNYIHLLYFNFPPQQSLDAESNSMEYVNPHASPHKILTTMSLNLKLFSKSTFTCLLLLYASYLNAPCESMYKGTLFTMVLFVCTCTNQCTREHYSPWYCLYALVQIKLNTRFLSPTLFIWIYQVIPFVFVDQVCVWCLLFLLAIIACYDLLHSLKQHA